MARDRGLTVAVTGAAGYLGTCLVASLAGDDAIDHILAFDTRSLRTSSSKVIFDRMDVRDAGLAARLNAVDVVVHLAFVMDPIRDESLMRDVNVNGTQNVLRCAGNAGVRRIVYTSSGTAYGAHPDNDVPLTEDSPLRANLDFSYPAHKLEAEYVVREFRDDHPDVSVAVLRPAVVFGPHADNAWSHMLEAPVFFSIAGYEPPFQFVHEDDVAAALHFCVLNDLDGAYNVCPRDWLDFDEIESLIGRPHVRLPEPAAFAVAERAWRWGLGEAPAGYLHYVMHPWVMAPDKLESAGFRCERSSFDALMDTLTVTNTRLRLGRRRVERRDLRRAAVAGGSLLGGVALWKGVRSKAPGRRRHRSARP